MEGQCKTRFEILGIRNLNEQETSRYIFSEIHIPSIKNKLWIFIRELLPMGYIFKLYYESFIIGYIL